MKILLLVFFILQGYLQSVLDIFCKAYYTKTAKLT